MSIGDNIRKARGRIKQSELAEILNIDVSTISRWENNKNVPSSNILKKIADALNTTVDYLLGETNSTSNIPESHNLPQNLAFIPARKSDEKGNNEYTDLKEPNKIERGNNMYIIRHGEYEYYIPDTPKGQEIFLTFLQESLKAMKLSEPTPEINNGTNSNYHNSTVNNGTLTVTTL